jgi:hypothetical protein
MRRAGWSALLAAIAIASCTAAAAAVTAPRAGITDIAHLPTPLPFPYDERANPDAQIAAAFARARASGKRVIIELGGNWCSWCRILEAVMALPDVKPFVDRHFEVVKIDVGKFDRNLHIPKRFGLANVEAVPYVFVTEPDGRVIHHSFEITDEHHETPQAMVDWLASWARAPVR